MARRAQSSRRRSVPLVSRLAYRGIITLWIASGQVRESRLTRHKIGALAKAFGARRISLRPQTPLLAGTPELHSRARCNLMQAVENLCGWYRLSLSRVKACDALCSLRFP